ncbi:23S rRNA (uracil(1939)-C(5))-methyltransferase RlmD [Roseburia sp. AM51-8]|jgi:23S rRNA (uracil1939-C5)-methyltransferase|nr:23S rRNA (uracil(1939)-C(5))-methyltransferase RlmD [Roseburia sp. AM51-8]RHQ01357.1 23S rRNA (uracil(1939)-C(5))-methyltransferase RlmD [Roseburia sp. AM51-8]
MKKNDTFILKIEDMGIGGEGIGKYEGMTFFVKDAVIGDEILAGVTKLKKGYGYARLVEIVKPSPKRVEAPCKIARQCGGCQIQNLCYEEQLVLKQKKVENNLRRIGSFSQEQVEKVMEPVVGMEDPFRYRNKAQFPCGYDKDGNIVFGFYAARSHQVIPIDDCLLGVSENAKILAVIKEYMEACHIKPYDETTGQGLLRHVLIRKGFHSGQVMVCLIINGDKLPQADRLVESLSEVPGMHSISYNVNKEKTNRILGDKVQLLWGDLCIRDTIHRVREEESGGFTRTDESVTFAISPKSFYQVNPVQTEKLYSLALEYAGLTGKEIVWDLYCGIGTISLFLAQAAKHVYGVEIVPEAVADARENAKNNQIENATFYVGKAEEVLPAWVEEHADDGDAGLHPDVIVVDPPRKGCDEKCLETMVAMAPERIVYVSCDSATLARDLKYLQGKGYEVLRVRPVDQFCHSMHVETVVLLSHKKPDGHINVKVEFGEGEGKVPLDNIAKRAEEYKPKERVTYKMIKEYIEAKYGFKVHTAYIAEVKRDLGLPMYDAPNAVEELKQPRKHPTAEKVEAIKDALKHFEVI